MQENLKPILRPERPFFSSGPCPKFPDWQPDIFNDALLNRSHRSEVGRDRIALILKETRDLLKLPPEYALAVTPASGTGAIEMAFWSLLGQRPVDVLAFEQFGYQWAHYILQELKIDGTRLFKADYGYLPDINKINFSHDVVFPWTGTSAGITFENENFIPSDRQGLVLCDASAAIFMREFIYEKFDIISFSWQKALGSEAAHGMLIFSPRALERLKNYTPPWPIPKIFRLKNNNQILENFFKGETLNTPSLLCIEDYLYALKYAKQIGGLKALIFRVEENYEYLQNFINQTAWLENLVLEEKHRAHNCVCLKIIDPLF